MHDIADLHAAFAELEAQAPTELRTSPARPRPTPTSCTRWLGPVDARGDWYPCWPPPARSQPPSPRS